MGSHLTIRSVAAASAALLLAAGLLAPEPAQASIRKLLNHLDVTVFVADDFKCARKIELFVAANERSTFDGDRKKLQRALGGARASLSFECESIQVEDAVVYGVVNRKLVYRGLVTQQNNWVLVDLPLSSNQGTAQNNGQGHGNQGGGATQNTAMRSAQKPSVEVDFSTAVSEPPISVFLP